MHEVGFYSTHASTREDAVRGRIEVARIADAGTGENAVRERAEDRGSGVHDDFFEEENDGLAVGIKSSRIE